MTGYSEFEFDLPEALLARLVVVLDAMDAAPLNAESLAAVEEAQGVYQLFLDNALVYIGKTDAEAGLHKRLVRHAKKILHRKDLDPARVSFKAVRIFVFTAMDLEAELIRHYGGTNALAWNGSGFGSNDPGRRRDKTRVEDDNFDGQFPIDIDRDIDIAIAEGTSAADALAALKGSLPYTFRFENAGGRSRKAHRDLEAATVSALAGPVTVRSAVEHIVQTLPPGWQATALPGYIILYKERVRYPRAIVIARS